MRYEQMSKPQLLQELLDRGIDDFGEKDSRETIIEILYREDELDNDDYESPSRHLKNSEW